MDEYHIFLRSKCKKRKRCCAEEWPIFSRKDTVYTKNKRTKSSRITTRKRALRRTTGEDFVDGLSFESLQEHDRPRFGCNQQETTTRAPCGERKMIEPKFCPIQRFSGPCVQERIQKCRAIFQETANGEEVIIQTKFDHMMWNVNHLNNHMPVTVTMGNQSVTTLLWQTAGKVVFGFKSPGSKVYYAAAYRPGPGAVVLTTDQPHPLSVSEREMADDHRFFLLSFKGHLGGYVLRAIFDPSLSVSVSSGHVTLVRVSDANLTLWDVDYP